MLSLALKPSADTTIYLGLRSLADCFSTITASTSVSEMTFLTEHATLRIARERNRVNTILPTTATPPNIFSI